MDGRDEIKKAVMDQLAKLHATPETPINLYAIGPQLVVKGYTQTEIVHALESLMSEKVIEYVSGNQVRLVEGGSDEQSS